MNEAYFLYVDFISNEVQQRKTKFIFNLMNKEENKNMNLKVNLAGIKMKNPVTVASGTFGYGREYSEFIDLNKLGGIITKGTSLKPRPRK